MRLREVVAVAKRCGWVEKGSIPNPTRPGQNLGVDASGRTAGCFYSMVVEEAMAAGWEPADKQAKLWQNKEGLSADQYLVRHKDKLAEARKGSMPPCGSYASGLDGYNED